MDAHTWGQIILGLITLTSGIWSSLEKRRFQRQVKANTDHQAAMILKSQQATERAQKIAADTLAELQRVTTERLERKIEEVHSDLRQNTQITEQVAEVNVQALSAANNFNAKWQILAEADAEKLLSGRLAEITIGSEEKTLKDIHRIDTDTNRRVRNVEEKVQEISLGQKDGDLK